MNPWALVIIGVGIMLIIIGVKGTQHDIAGAITGHGTSFSSSSAKGNQEKAGATTTGTVM